MSYATLGDGLVDVKYHRHMKELHNSGVLLTAKGSEADNRRDLATAWIVHQGRSIGSAGLPHLPASPYQVPHFSHAPSPTPHLVGIR